MLTCLKSAYVIKKGEQAGLSPQIEQYYNTQIAKIYFTWVSSNSMTS